MCVWSFLLHFPKLQPTLYFQLSFKPSCISWASTWPRVILFITEMPMATMLVLVFQDAQALDLITLGRISPSPPSLWQFLLQEEILKDFFVCLFVCICLECGSWSICIYSSQSWMQFQDAFLRLQEEKVLGGNTLGNTKTHLHLICLQTSRQHYISFVWFLFSSKVGLYCSFSDFKLLDTLFVVFLFLPSAIVMSLFWFQASSCRRIYWGIIGWAYKSMLIILPAPSFFGNQCIFSSFLWRFEGNQMSYFVVWYYFHVMLSLKLWNLCNYSYTLP